MLICGPPLSLFYSCLWTAIEMYCSLGGIAKDQIWDIVFSLHYESSERTWPAFLGRPLKLCGIGYVLSLFESEGTYARLAGLPKVRTSSFRGASIVGSTTPP